MERVRQVAAVARLAARNRRLRRLELAFAAFNGAEWGVWVAILVYGYAHGGANGAAAIALIQLIPSAVLAPSLAALADRKRPGRVLLASYLAMAASMGAVAAAIALSAPVAVVFALAPLVNLALSVPRPAQAALLPGLVSTPIELSGANVVSSWMENVSVLIAPAVSGLLLGVGGPQLSIAAMGGLALVAAALVAPLPGPAPIAIDEEDDRPGMADDVRESVAMIARDRPARLLVGLLGAQFVLIGALDLLYVVLAISVLGMGQSGAGYLSAAVGAGGLIGGVVAAALVGRRHLAPLLVCGIAAAGAALVTLGARPTVASAFLLLAVAGLGRAVFDVSGRTLLQRVAPPDMLARVFGLLESLMNACLAIGSLLVPILIAASGARAALIGAGALLILLIAATGRSLLAVDEAADVPVVEIALLRSIPLFAALPAPALETLGRALEPVDAEPGTVLMRQGEPGDRYYAIAEGELDVARNGAKVATLGRGEGVGEIALLEDVPRTATVTAPERARLYALTKEPFVLALTGHPPAHRTARGVVQSRREQLVQLDSG
ncbi:MAG TPA: MFS transporter [Gaiellales bacterium]|nr:MFS transporter [Gaiellales bacterium]